MTSQRVELWGGWSLTLPSTCTTTRNEDGSWSAWDESHVVDVSIIEYKGGPTDPERVLADLDGWETHQLEGAFARVTRMSETTDTKDGPQQVEWTRMQAAAPQTVIVLGVANQGACDAAWHDALWRSVVHRTPSRRGLLDRLKGR